MKYPVGFTTILRIFFSIFMLFTPFLGTFATEFKEGSESSPKGGNAGKQTMESRSENEGDNFFKQSYKKISEYWNQRENYWEGGKKILWEYWGQKENYWEAIKEKLTGYWNKKESYWETGTQKLGEYWSKGESYWETGKVKASGWLAGKEKYWKWAALTTQYWFDQTKNYSGFLYDSFIKGRTDEEYWHKVKISGAQKEYQRKLDAIEEVKKTESEVILAEGLLKKNSENVRKKWALKWELDPYGKVEMEEKQKKKAISEN